MARPRWLTTVEVVLIVGILAAIAVPNFFYASGRVLPSQVQSEMRQIAVALDSFFTVNGRFPSICEFYSSGHSQANDIPVKDATFAFTLTSPMDHILKLAGDPYHERRRYHYYYYTDLRHAWILGSVGPDGHPDFFLGAANSFKNERAFVESARLAAASDYCRFFEPRQRGGAPGASAFIYEPSNGFISRGDIIKTGP